MDFKLEDIIDIPLLQDLQEKLNLIYSFPSAIIDNHGKILTAVAWQDICTKFHRKHPECEKECTKSDKYILEHLHEAKPAVSYTCPHGLVDNATPIIISGKHLGNFFTGQFFLEKPDLKFFRNQAKQYGFDEKEYLEAVEKVPVWTKEKLEHYLDFIKGFIEIIASIGLNHLKEIETNKRIKENEERNQAIIQSTSDWIWEVDQEGKYCYCSEKVEQVLGYSVDEIIGKTPFDLMPPDEAKRVESVFQEIIANKATIVDLENWNLHKDGHRVCLLTNGFPVFDEHGNLIGYRGADKDITERVRTQQELIQNKQRFEGLVNLLPEAVFEMDMNFKITYVNQRALNMFGYILSDLSKGIKALEILVPGDRDRAAKNFDKRFKGEEPGVVEYEAMKKDGSTFPILFHASSIIEKDKLIGARGVIVDITERKKTEDELKESEKRFKTITENSPDAIFLVDKQGNYVYANQSASNLLGYSEEEILALNIKDIGEQNIAGKRFGELLQKGKMTAEMPLRKKNGTYVEVDINALVLPNGLLYGSCRDLTERKKAEKTLKESEERFSLAMSASNDGLFDWNLETNEIYYSPGWKKMLGYEDHELLNDFSIWENLTEPEDVKNSWELQQKLIAKQIERFVMEFKMKHKNGHWVDILSRAEAYFNDEGKAIRIVGTHTNITERKKTSIELIQAKEKAEETEARYKELFVNMMNAFALHEMIFNEKGEPVDYKFLEVNPYWEKIVGIKAETVINKTIREIMPDIEDSWIQVYGRIVKTGIAEEFEDYNKATQKYYHIYAYRADPGKFAVLFNDVTERKNWEKILRENEEKYRLLHENAGLGIGYFNTDGNVISFNKLAAMYMGGVPEDFEGKSIYEIFQKEEANFYYSRIKKATVSNEPTIYEDHVLLPGGDKYFLSTFTKITDSNNKILGIQIISQDISEQKITENALRESEMKFRSTFDQSPVGSVIVGLDKRFIRCNASFCNFLGYNEEEMIGHTIAEFTHPDDIEIGMKELQQLAKCTTESTRLQKRYIRKDSAIVWGEVSIRIVCNEEKNPLYFLPVIQDITQQKLTELELIKAKEKAEESDRLKSAFLANMSHEIRTPMNGILGFTSLLQEPNLTGEEQQKYIKIIQKSGDRMLNTINDIVDISKIEAGQMIATVSEVNIQKKLENVHTFFKPEADKKGIKLTLKKLLSGKDIIIQSDNKKLDSILTNLVKNALKFCDEGTVEFGCSVKENELLFYVKDSGIGIPENRQQAIFERFVQADIEDRQARQGSGLGLAISKAYVEMLDGKIWVESEPGKGSVFYFTIPYNDKPKEKNSIKEFSTKNENKGEIKKLNILIAEDDPASVMFLEIMLKPIAKNILICSTGIEAVEMCRNNPDIDLVLMDIQMPEMNGFEATRQIRQFKTDVVIIAQTAFALTGDKEKALEAGCNDYIAKPIKGADLNILIKKYFN